MQDYRQRAAAVFDHAKDAVKAFISEIAAQNVLTVPPATTLRISPTGIDVLKKEDQRVQLALSVAGRPQEAVKGVLEKLGASLGESCALEFATGLSMMSQMILPSESDEILKAIIRNKVESIAPWPLSQSLYGQKIQPVPGDASHVSAQVGVVSRALVEDIAGQLAAAGTVVKAASLQMPDGEALRMDFGSREESREAQRVLARFGSGFAVGAALVSAIGLLLVWHSSSRLAMDRAEKATLMGSLQPGAAGGAKSLTAAANRLHEKRRQRLPAVAVLNELSGLLPPTVWVDSLSLEDTRVEIKGQGTNVPLLIDILEQSGTFAEVNFAAATQFNAELNAEAFSIGAMLEPASEKEGVP